MSNCYVKAEKLTMLVVILNVILFVMTAWEVAGEYIYTAPGDQDTDYLMLTLDVPGYR